MLDARGFGVLSAGMSDEPWYQKVQREAGERLEALLALPIADDDCPVDCDKEFDPWRLFPSLYGSYSGDFDQTALEVLQALQLVHEDRWDEVYPMQGREGLAHHMIREMLCTGDLCDYGTSPRVCFPTQEFGPLIAPLIEKWKAYYEKQWGEPYAPQNEV